MTKNNSYENQYTAYIPDLINHNYTFNDNRIFMLLEQGASVLSELNTICQFMDFNNILANMYVHLEALCSSEIEGTHAEIKDLFQHTKRDNEDVQKIWNLYDTTHYYFNNKELTGAELYCTKTIEKINKDLFKKVTSINHYTGKVRNFQNFVGGTNILSASFIPAPPEMVKKLMKDLNDFWLNDSYFIPKLIKIAIYHFQFETIHPFVDGNGRTGRLLISLQLRDSGLLDLPVLCLSDYWKKNKGQYYEALTIARYTRNLEHWIRFFIQSIISTGNERIETIVKIIKLKNDYIEEIRSSIKSPYNHLRTLDYLINETPIISVKELAGYLGLTYQGANKIIENFVTMGLLVPFGENKRNRSFIFEKYHDLVFNSYREF